ncbi:hypothetical protein JW926_16185 [Candidatus Sumerlaeota bacterium]|nr:hypothetical protein [Candidatus Sumerlaeota bacterium]
MKSKTVPITQVTLFVIFSLHFIAFSQNSVDPIISSIQEKLNHKNSTVLQELNQLKQMAQTDPKAVLSIADSHNDQRIRRISLLALDESSDPGLENMLLEKWDKWAGEDDALFLSSMQVLGKKGAQNTIKKCIQELENGNQLQRTAALTALTWMRKTHPSEETRIMANETLERAKIRGEHIKEPEICLLSNADLLQKCLNAPDKIRLKLHLHEIGERALLGALDGNSAELKKPLDEIISKQIQNLESPKRETQSDASENIQRLWSLCAPRLIECCGHDNPYVADAASQNLTLMRDRQIMEKIIEKSRTTTNLKEKQSCIYTLGGMKNKVFSMIRGREVLCEEESEKIAHELIIPYLNQEKERDTRPEIRSAIQRALENLAHPHDLRPQPPGFKPMKMW